ncbi:MAG: hypothetical protein GKS00_10875 [Alphaproteobacteria bacterium]|nr:hypothetical protein [Alphaproteobacteria bacterium]
MSASAFRSIPDGSRIAIQIADDTDINLRLRDVAARALIRAGYTVIEDSPAFTLRLETQHRAAGVRTDRSIGSLRAGSGVGSPAGNVGGPQGTGVDLNLKLWSSSRNSLLSPKSGGSAPKQGFGVQLDVYDEKANKPAWRGFARVDDNRGDSYRTGSIMVKRLVEALGISVETESLSLQ